MKKILHNKKFISLYLIWVLIHSFLLLCAKNSDGYPRDFWPITSSQLGAYDISEWFAYSFSPPVILLLLDTFDIKTMIIILLLGLTHAVQAQPEYIVPEKASELQQFTEYPNLKDLPKPIDVRIAKPKAEKGYYKPHEMDELEKLSKYGDPNNKFYNSNFDKDASRGTAVPVNTYSEVQNREQPTVPSPAASPASELPDKQIISNEPVIPLQRFMNSPCYPSLGFDPDGDIRAQEARYTACENSKQVDGIKRIAISGSLLAGITLLVLIGMRGTSNL